METKNAIITIESTINAPIEKVWATFTNPDHVIHWNFAHPSWHCPKAETDLKVGGKFNYRMDARDGSFGFDFWGTFNSIEINKSIECTLGDGRKMKTVFTSNGNSTLVSESFEAEKENPEEMQKNGWQAILDNFKSYAEKING